MNSKNIKILAITIFVLVVTMQQQQANPAFTIILPAIAHSFQIPWLLNLVHSNEVIPKTFNETQYYYRTSTNHIKLFSTWKVDDWANFAQSLSTQQKITSVQELFSHFDLYQYPSFRTFLKNNSEYGSYTIGLAEKISVDQAFADSLSQISLGSLGNLKDYILQEASPYCIKIDAAKIREIERVQRKVDASVQIIEKEQSKQIYTQRYHPLIAESKESSIVDYGPRYFSRKKVAAMEQRLDEHATRYEVRMKIATTQEHLEQITKEIECAKKEALNLKNNPLRYNKVNYSVKNASHKKNKITIVSSLVNLSLEMLEKAKSLSDNHDLYGSYLALDAAHNLNALAASLSASKQDVKSIVNSYAFSTGVRTLLHKLDHNWGSEKTLGFRHRYHQSVLAQQIVVNLAELALREKNSLNFVHSLTELKTMSMVCLETEKIIALTDSYSKRTVLDALQLIHCKPNVIEQAKSIVDGVNNAAIHVLNIEYGLAELHQQNKINLETLPTTASAYFLTSATTAQTTFDIDEERLMLDKDANIWSSSTNRIRLSNIGINKFGWIHEDAINGTINADDLPEEIKTFKSMLDDNRSAILEKITLPNKPQALSHTSTAEVASINKSTNLNLETNSCFLDSLTQQHVASLQAQEPVAAARYQERINALQQTQLDSGTIRTHTYELAPHARDLLVRHGVNPMLLQNFTGTAIQQQVHGEIVELVNQSAGINVLYKSPETKALIESTATLGQVAYKLNTEHNAQAALSFVDLCKVALHDFLTNQDHLLQHATGTKVDKKTLESINHDLRHLRALGRGIKNSMARTYHMVRHPLDTVKTIVSSCMQVLAHLPPSASDTISPDAGFLSNHIIDKSVKEQVAFWNNVADQVGEQIQWSCASPENMLEALGGFFGDAALFKMAGKVPTAAALVRSRAANGGSILAGLGPIGQQVEQALGLTVKHGAIPVQDGLTLLQHYPAATEVFVENLETAITHAQDLKTFAVTAAQKNIERLDNAALTQEMSRLNLPAMYIPEPTASALPVNIPIGRTITYTVHIPAAGEATIIPAHTTDMRYLDFSGNRWSQTVSGSWNVELSPEFQSKFGWALENKATLDATEFSEKITQTFELINIPATPYLKIKKTSPALAGYYSDLHEEISSFQQKFALHSEHLRPTQRDVEHIFDIQFKIDKYGSIKKVHGFHHDYLRTFERIGVFEVIEEKMGPGGCYRLKFKINGIEVTKTFFPPHWTREKVMKKIFEARNNLIEKPEIHWDNSVTLVGKTSEGIEIVIIEGPTKNMPTAYPKF